MSPLKDVRALTGLRGVAVTQVVFYHYLESCDIGPWQVLVGRGYLAVDVFFVLSGFVMALNYEGLAHRFEVQAYLAFLWKRVGRIYPLYLFGIVASLALALLGLKNLPDLPGAIVTNILLIQAWGLGSSINGPTWSISTEFATYLLFPLLALAALHPRARWFTGAAAIGLLVYVATRTDADLGQVSDVARHRHGPLDAYNGATPFPLLRCLAGFTWGLVAYGFAMRPEIRTWLGARTAVLALGAVALMLAGESTDVAVVLVCGPLIVALCVPTSAVAAFLGSRPVHFIGLISYSIYVDHRLVNTLFRDELAHALGFLQPGPAWIVSGVVETVPLVLISIVTFRWIEEPARRWARDVLRDQFRPAALDVRTT